MKFLLATLMVALLLSPFAKQAQAESASKPVLVASFSGLDEITKDAEFLAKLANFEDVDKFKGFLSLFAGGIDHKRPWGMTVHLDGANVKPLVFVPVTKFSDVINKLKLAGIEVEKGKDGIYEIDAQVRTFVAKESDGWAFVGMKPEDLKDLPKKPIELLGGLHKKYDIAIKGNIENVPEEYIKMAVEGMKAGLAQGMQQNPGESDDDYAARKKLMDGQFSQMVTAIKDSEALTFGISVDREKKNANIDIVYTVKPGTKLAKQVENLKDLKTEFGGFIHSDAAMSMNLTSIITKEDAKTTLETYGALKEQAMKAIDDSDDFPDDDTKKAVKKVATDMIKVFEKTLEEGKIDGAASVILKPDSMTVIAAGRVADGKTVQKSFDEIVKMLADEPGFPGVKDGGTYKGISMKTMSVPVPDDNAQKVFGENLSIIFGTGEKGVYFAMGKDAMKTLKTAIDNSGASKGKSVDLLSIAIGVGSILEFAESVEDEPVLKMLAKIAKDQKGKDRVIISEKIIKNGVIFQIKLEEGVLNIIGKGAEAAAKLQGAF